MKRFFLILLVTICSYTLHANDKKLERIPLAVVVEDIPEPFPQTARVHLINKINNVLSTSGIMSVNYSERFLVVVEATPLTKDIVPGPPMQIAQNLEFSLYIVDNIEKKVFTTYSFETKGVGTNETKAYMDAIKRIRPNQKELLTFAKEAKERIVSYYNAEVNNYIIKAKTLAKREKYEEAFFWLSCVPAVCDKYADVLSVAEDIYQQYIDKLCIENLSLAKSAWMAEQNREGAAQAGIYLSLIYSDASCYKDAEELYNEIKGKVLDDWKFEMKKYNDSVELEQQRIDSWKAIGVAFGENQKPVTNTVTWLLK